MFPRTQRWASIGFIVCSLKKHQKPLVLLCSCSEIRKKIYRIMTKRSSTYRCVPKIALPEALNIFTQEHATKHSFSVPKIASPEALKDLHRKTYYKMPHLPPHPARWRAHPAAGWAQKKKVIESHLAAGFSWKGPSAQSSSYRMTGSSCRMSTKKEKVIESHLAAGFSWKGSSCRMTGSSCRMSAGQDIVVYLKSHRRRR